MPQLSRWKTKTGSRQIIVQMHVKAENPTGPPPSLRMVFGRMVRETADADHEHERQSGRGGGLALRLRRDVEGGILVRGNMAAMIAGVVAVVAAASSWCTRVSYKCGKSLSLLSSACNTLVTPTPPCGQTSFR
tara:strand:- start:321 stop:719 length:399 start_codon:yes stop_codon:yes gene_type:complete